MSLFLTFCSKILAKFHGKQYLLIFSFWEGFLRLFVIYYGMVKILSQFMEVES